jgi:competence protein ComEC
MKAVNLLIKWTGPVLVLLMGLLFFCFVSLPDGLLHVFILNVGQGDSILIRTPQNDLILVDGGPNDQVLQELSSVLPFYERTIDLMILTHPHPDHVNGLIEVLRRYDVKQVMMTGIDYSYAGYDTFLNLLKEKGIEVILINGKNDYRTGNVIIDVLYPLKSVQGQEFLNVNNSSIVFRLIYGKNRFYFAGDLEKEGEAKLVESGLDLRADALKVGHHGSRTSSSEALLDEIRPEMALISCGIDNKFKHPHPETISKFQQRRIKVSRTDLDGRIEIR